MKKLYRSQTDCKIAGIFGGIAETYSVDATLLRLAAVFLGVATGILPLLIAYLIGWIIIPFREGEEAMKKLYRSQTDRKIAGIFGGIAETYSQDATLWRLGAVFLGVATGIIPLLVTYIIGWIIIPVRSGTVDLRTPPAGAGG